MPSIESNAKIPQRQTIATLNQAAPVQNTWYTILDTTLNVRINGWTLVIATTGETLETRITIDGNVLTSAATPVANDTAVYIYLATSSTGTAPVISTTNYSHSRSFIVEGRRVKIEVRKTTAVGAGNLRGAVDYSVF